MAQSIRHLNPSNIQAIASYKGNDVFFAAPLYENEDTTQ